MKNNIVIISIIAVFTVLVVGLVWISSLSSQEAVVPTANAKAVVGKEFHDWGEIGIKNGKVETEFEVKNEGTEVLKLTNIVTSCSCTTAQVIADDGDSPTFGMHSKSAYVKEVAPGSSVIVKAVYDPMFHGPSGIGAISREVTIETNDAANPKLRLKMAAQVVDEL